MATISLVKEGAKCKVIVDNATTTPYVNQSEVYMSYNTGDTISITIKSFSFTYSNVLPIASVTIGGVVITSQTVFDTQIAAVFPNATSGSGGSGTQAVYAATPTFTAGTAPSGSTNHTYQWTQAGTMVALRINLLFSVAGATVTVFTLPLPSDCPTPLVPTGYTTNDYIYSGSGSAATASNGFPSSATRCVLRATATPSIATTVTSGAHISFYVTVIYWTS